MTIFFYFFVACLFKTHIADRKQQYIAPGIIYCFIVNNFSQVIIKKKIFDRKKELFPPPLLIKKKQNILPKEPPGVHILDFEGYDLLSGWEKIWWFAKKKRKYKGEELENGEKEEIFTVPMVKNIIFL